MIDRKAVRAWATTSQTGAPWHERHGHKESVPTLPTTDGTEISKRLRAVRRASEISGTISSGTAPLESPWALSS
jgi:hypothetical protein